jgi:hypothetical protein
MDEHTDPVRITSFCADAPAPTPEKEPNQPVLVLALLIDANGQGQLQFKRYDNATGKRIASGTTITNGIVQTLGRIEDVLAIAFTTPLKLASRPSPNPEANTRTLPCGCVISTTGTGQLRECEQHQLARRERADDQARRAKR